MKLLPLMLLSGALLTACVDQNYDLTKIDTDQIAIGDEDSEFRIPLATVQVTMEEIAQNGTDIRAIFHEADIWLPSSAREVDITELTENSAYRSRLIAETIDELKTSDAKLNQIVNLTYENYYDRFATVLGIDPDLGKDPSLYAEAFARALNSEYLSDVITEQISTVSSEYLESIRIDAIEYDLDGLDLDDKVIDMLCDNLDPEGTLNPTNTLAIYGTITNRLPLSLHVAPLFMPTEIELDIQVDAAGEESDIPETRLYGDALRQFVQGVHIRIPVELGTYYPGIGFDDNASHQMVIRLYLVKRGGMKLEF